VEVALLTIPSENSRRRWICSGIAGRRVIDSGLLQRERVNLCRENWELFEKLKKMIMAKCPFVNLPKSHKSRWGQGLTAEDMKKCVWLRPKSVAQIEFLEWTKANHLGHARFIALRDDKGPRFVEKEKSK
jgi:ATP dependent DNA ligase C terminal region